MIGQNNVNLMVRLVLGAALLLLILWGSGTDSAGSKEPQNQAARPLHRTAANIAQR